MIRRGGLKRGNFLFQLGGFRYDDKGLGCGDGEHDSQDKPWNNGTATSDEQQADERYCATDQPPMEITGDEDTDNPAGYVARIGLEEEWGQDKGKQGSSAQPTGDGKMVDGARDISLL